MNQSLTKTPIKSLKLNVLPNFEIDKILKWTNVEFGENGEETARLTAQLVQGVETDICLAKNIAVQSIHFWSAVHVHNFHNYHF